MYDPSKPSSFIIYIDANNLYGWAMSQMLPNGARELEWLNEDELRHLYRDFTAVGSEKYKQYRSTEGGFTEYFFLEVDLDYPDRLPGQLADDPFSIHDRDDDFPMAPEQMFIDPKFLAKKQEDLYKRFYKKDEVPGSRKLVCSLLPKRHYVCFSENLFFYLEHGMILRKVRIYLFIIVTF